MGLPHSLLMSVLQGPSDEAWRELFSHALRVCRDPLPLADAASAVQQRDQALAAVDLFLATAGWDLWRSYEASVPHTADALAEFWNGRGPGRAVLILDGLSLRELPWILQGASDRGYAVLGVRAAGAELPADTNSFARALGFAQRSALENNGAGGSHRMPGARTDCVALPWRECVDLIGSQPDWILWHQWPDARLHDLSGPGGGIATLAEETAQKLSGDDFWALVERLTTGRRLAITSDHGYAASGLFPDTADPEQAAHLKGVFRSQRFAAANGAPERAWVPPVDLRLTTRHGAHDFVLGRRKWKSAGGYPTLTHGGLSLLEVAVPFVELSRSPA